MTVLLAVSLIYLARCARFDIRPDGIALNIPFQYITDLIVSLS